MSKYHNRKTTIPTGETGDFELKYDPISRRFSEEYAGAKIYGWEKLS